MEAKNLKVDSVCMLLLLSGQHKQEKMGGPPTCLTVSAEHISHAPILHVALDELREILI